MNVKKTIFFCISAQALVFFIAMANDYFIQISNSNGFDLEFDSQVRKFFLVVFLAPIFETLIFKVGSNELLSNWIKSRSKIIIISSLFFGLSHTYSLLYVFFALLGGLVFNSLYFYIRDYKPWWFAGLIVFIIHANHNLIGFLLGK